MFCARTLKRSDSCKPPAMTCHKRKKKRQTGQGEILPFSLYEVVHCKTFQLGIHRFYSALVKTFGQSSYLGIGPLFDLRQVLLRLNGGKGWRGIREITRATVWEVNERNEREKDETGEANEGNEAFSYERKGETGNVMLRTLRIRTCVYICVNLPINSWLKKKPLL